GQGRLCYGTAARLDPLHLLLRGRPERAAPLSDVLLAYIVTACMLCRLCVGRPPATTRREPIPDSLMPSLAANGRSRGVPVERHKTPSLEGFYFQHHLARTCRIQKFHTN